jgi:hypothetical protein
MWFAGSGSSAGHNLVLYQDYDATNTSSSTGNQLVETVSTDGTHFLPVVNTNVSGLTGDCAGAAIQDCVTNNEGISGNQIVDPKTGNVYIAHTSTEGLSNAVGVRISGGKITLGTPTTAVWSESPNLDGSLCPGSTKAADGSNTCVDASGNAMELAGENFASIARDSAGYLYVTFTAGPLDHAKSSDPGFGALTKPEQIYVVHSLQPIGPDPSRLTWSAPMAITSAGTNTFPWITAGSDGRVDVVWYHSDERSETGTCASGSGTCTLYGAGSFTKAEWTVQMGQSLNAHGANPTWTIAPVSETPVKYGQICTNGLGCTTGGDRSVGDFLQVTTDAQGAALVSYVFDTSADTSAGENFGPEVISRQLSGPGLLSSVSGVSQGSGPGVPMGSVTDPTGDAYLSQNGMRTPAGDNLDLTGAALQNGPNNTLVATIDVKSLKSLGVSPGVGGPDGSWLIRWTEVTPGQTGNGHIYYAGMDSNGGTGSPSFFDGDTAGVPPPNPGEHTKYVTFPPTNSLSASQASYDANTGVIRMHIPRADVGSPPNGTVLYSVTAFSATSTVPQSATTLFNLTDATTPFDLVVGPPGSVGNPPVPPGGGGHHGSRCPLATGRLAGRSLGPLSLEMTRNAARHRLGFSPRDRQFMDFFCLSPIGIRAAYPSPQLEALLRPSQRQRVHGRIILLLTANPYYVLDGVQPGERLVVLSKRVRIGRRHRIGLNDWYVFGNGASRGVLEVRRRTIEEIGIADVSITRTALEVKRLLNMLR